MFDVFPRLARRDKWQIFGEVSFTETYSYCWVALGITTPLLQDHKYLSTSLCALTGIDSCRQIQDAPLL